jgi:uncharacterized protein YbbC (DUF1343 family)
MNMRLVIILFWCAHTHPFTLGVENISAAHIDAWCGKRVGLITNQTGKDQKGMRTVDVLRAKKIEVACILVPEHGLNGTVSAEHEVTDGKDTTTSIPVMSLYGKCTGKKVSPEVLAALDLLIFDIQDAGMRHYTYISTLYHCMQSAAEHNKEFVVLDRPNPLGHCMEGPLVEQGLLSFISIAPIPVRHGLTVGELARYFNAFHCGNKVSLAVVPMHGYTRDMALPATIPAYFSPNIPTLTACHGYSFLGLLGEVRPFDVGLGTDHAFACIGLPETIACSKKEWCALQALLQKKSIESTVCSYFSKRKKCQLHGLRVHIKDINAVPAFSVFLSVLQFFKEHGVKLTFSKEFDKAVGTKKIQELINGALHQSACFSSINNDVHNFFHSVKPLLLYSPAPLIMMAS